MKIRADLHINGEHRRPFLASGPNETDEHLVHRLAGYLLFWNDDPILDASMKTPALASFDFRPDLLALDEAGDIKLWAQCGAVTRNMLTKITRRAPRARVVVLKENEREAQRLRRELDEQFDRPERVEVLAWPGDSFREWRALVTDRVEAYGESDGRSLNATVNETPLFVEFKTVT
jgi:uncharacterized protein YaeQ